MLLFIIAASFLPVFSEKHFQTNSQLSFYKKKNYNDSEKKNKFSKKKRNKPTRTRQLLVMSFQKMEKKNKDNKWICFSHNILSDLIETPNSNQRLENNTLNTYSKRLFATTQNNTFPPALPDILNLPNNNSSDHSPHNFIKNQQLQQLQKPEEQQQQQEQQEQQNTHYQGTPNTLKSISFPEKIIFAHPEKFGIVQEDKNNSNYTHVYLYRHEIALTPNELTQMKKNYINYNKPKVYKLHNYVNTKKKNVTLPS